MASNPYDFWSYLEPAGNQITPENFESDNSNRIKKMFGFFGIIILLLTWN